MPWRTSNAKSLLPPSAKGWIRSVRMFVQAVRVERQPDPESPRNPLERGPIRVRSEVVDYSRVKNGFKWSHRISGVVYNHFYRHQETGNKKTVNLHQVTGNVSKWRIFRYPHSRVTSSETVVSEKAP